MAIAMCWFLDFLSDELVTVMLCVYQGVQGVDLAAKKTEFQQRCMISD